MGQGQHNFVYKKGSSLKAYSLRLLVQPRSLLKLFHEEGSVVRIGLLSYCFELSGEQLGFHCEQLLQFESIGLLAA